MNGWFVTSIIFILNLWRATDHRRSGNQVAWSSRDALVATTYDAV